MSGSAIILGIGSDIGRELAGRLAADGWTVAGTHRGAQAPAGLPKNARSTACDMASAQDTAAAARWLREAAGAWDLVVVAAGTEEPIGSFWECDEQEWEKGIEVNALGPLRLVRALYPARRAGGAPCVAFFSGSGTNSAAPAYSAYAASKLFLIKMCELLDAESPDTSFFILGPGIVRTKIHEQTLKAGKRAGGNHRKVADFLGSADPGTSHDDIYACLRWCMAAGKPALGGRNISLAHDAWRGGGAALLRRLKEDAGFYKLRRSGNETKLK